ncbi:MAG: hypothetical protein OEO23_16970, partial [Gemmatimonadota bacterium]|nr:hypothetical protein [Gemmatimonadota bacterium]
MKRNLLAVLALAGCVGLVTCAQSGGGDGDMPQTAQGADGVMAPMFEVDPFWPKPLPNHWVLGSVVGVGVDSRDHVFIIHRQAPLNART